MRHLDLDGRVVLITGASRGIGADTARRPHERGARLGLVGLEPARLHVLAEELGPDAVAFEADVNDSAAVEAARALLEFYVPEYRFHLGSTSALTCFPRQAKGGYELHSQRDNALAASAAGQCYDPRGQHPYDSRRR